MNGRWPQTRLPSYNRWFPISRLRVCAWQRDGEVSSAVRVVICKGIGDSTVGMHISRPFGVPGEPCWLLMPSHLQGSTCGACLLFPLLRCHGSSLNNLLLDLKVSVGLRLPSIWPPSSVSPPPVLAEVPSNALLIPQCASLLHKMPCYFLLAKKKNAIWFRFNSDGAKTLWVSKRQKQNMMVSFFPKIQRKKKGKYISGMRSVNSRKSINMFYHTGFWPAEYIYVTHLWWCRFP